MKDIKLLIVDDEPIRIVLGRVFKLLGYHVDMVATGKDAISCLETDLFDLMILDMELPDLKGTEIITLAGRKYPNLAIVVLTGHASIDNAVYSLKNKAVMDYLQKPSTLEEVIDAVADALHKREMHLSKENLSQLVQDYPNLLPESDIVSNMPVKQGQSEALFVRPLLLNLPDRSARFVDNPDKVVTLSRGETAVLATLMSYPNQVVSCHQLVQKIWGYDVNEDQVESIIRPYISRLRKKLKETPDKPALIHTVRNRGYMLVSESY